MIKAYFVSGPETTFLVHSIEDARKFLSALEMCGVIDDKDEYTVTRFVYDGEFPVEAYIESEDFK